MKKRIITLLLTLTLAFAFAAQGGFADSGTEPAVASVDISAVLADKQTYYTEETDYIPGDCILTATRMMIRRAAILNGRSAWKNITNEAVRQVATVDGCLLSSFTFRDEGLSYEVGYGEFKGEGDDARIGEFTNLISKHPEGVVVHGDWAADSGMRGVLLTGVKGGVPYAMDASYNMGMFNEGIQKWSDTTMLEPSQCVRYWYIKDICEAGGGSIIDDCMSSEDIAELADPAPVTATASATVESLKTWKMLFRSANLISIY